MTPSLPVGDSSKGFNVPNPALLIPMVMLAIALDIVPFGSVIFCIVMLLGTSIVAPCLLAAFSPFLGLAMFARAFLRGLK